MGGESAEPYVNFFKLYEDGIKDGWVVDPSVFAERTIGSVEQDPLVYGSSPETMSWCSFSYSNQLLRSRTQLRKALRLVSPPGHLQILKNLTT